MIAIIDYDSGNTASVMNAFRALGEEVILTDNTAARDNDNLLFFLICKDRLTEQGIDADKVGFAELFQNAVAKVPPFETVTRLRRLVQNDFPELRGSYKKALNREQFRDEMKEYILEGDV